MTTKFISGWSLLALCGATLVVTGCASTDGRRARGGVGPAADYVDSTMPHRAAVWHIEDVDAGLDRTEPAQIVARVRAETTTSGWINPQFVPLTGNEPPKDGIYEFVLTAERPGGVVLQRITPMTAELVWRNPPPGVKGIRIHGVENRKEDRL
jgi:hypothetical protein